MLLSRALPLRLGVVLGCFALLLAPIEYLLCPPEPAGAEGLRDHRALIPGIGLMLAIAAGLLLSRDVVQPLRRLTEAADAISAGEFDHRIQLDRQDELGHLARSFNAMTDRLQSALAEVHEVNSYLEAEVARRTAELAAANQRLQLELDRRQKTEADLRLAKNSAESANRTKTLFLANMSHELRTPLHAIVGFSEILENQLFGPLGNDRYREYVADIRQSGVHLLKLINELLDISRIEAGAFELDEENLDLPTVVETCFQLVEHRARLRGVRLRQKLPAELPQIRGDQVRIRQILVNLLDNAIKFTPEGGLVALEADTLPDGALSIRVSDTGVGIAQQDLPKVLSIFGQVDSSFTRKHDGAGLGLPLARALAEKHGGRLSIESEVGAGTRVTVVLPADRMVPVPAAKASAQ